jgi:hypothetical protein
MERVYAPSTEVSTFITFPIGKRMSFRKGDLDLTKLPLGGILAVGGASTTGAAPWPRGINPPRPTSRRNTMKTFRHNRPNNEPCPEYPGDRMKKEGDFVEILRQPRGNETAVARVAIIHVLPGESVEELA